MLAATYLSVVLDILTHDLMSDADAFFHTAISWKVHLLTRTMVRLRHDS